MSARMELFKSSKNTIMIKRISPLSRVHRLGENISVIDCRSIVSKCCHTEGAALVSLTEREGPSGCVMCEGR